MKDHNILSHIFPMPRLNVYIGPEAGNSKKARELAKITLGENEGKYKVSSVQPNRSRGGWTICFKLKNTEDWT